MKRMLLSFLYWAAFCQVLEGVANTLRKRPQPCGDWTPYKDEKCFKIATKAGFQNHDDAEIVCESFSDELNGQSFPKLATIKNKEEQAFLRNYLFVDNKLVENVWLGLCQKNGSIEYVWNDGVGIDDYSNWANQTVSDNHHTCVQMESGEGSHESGLWVKVNCQTRLLVVCERTQTWTLENLQDTFLIYRVQLEKELKKLETTQTTLLNDKDQLEKEVKNLKTTQVQLEIEQKTANDKILHLEQNPVPLGFLYAQLPGQAPPSSIWPQVTWKDISSTYAGLFFRVLGGRAAEFNETQSDSSPELKVQSLYSGYDVGHDTEGITVVNNGSWSERLYTAGDNGKVCTLRFSTSTDEVRPRNTAVRIWQRA